MQKINYKPSIKLLKSYVKNLRSQEFCVIKIMSANIASNVIRKLRVAEKEAK